MRLISIPGYRAPASPVRAKKILDEVRFFSFHRTKGAVELDPVPTGKSDGRATVSVVATMPLDAFTTRDVQTHRTPKVCSTSRAAYGRRPWNERTARRPRSRPSRMKIRAAPHFPLPFLRADQKCRCIAMTAVCRNGYGLAEGRPRRHVLVFWPPREVCNVLPRAIPDAIGALAVTVPNGSSCC